MELSAVLALPETASRPRVDRDAGVLVGSRCASCGAVAWPARAICHSCGEPAMVESTFAPTGSLLTYTTVWVPRPGVEPPYTLGQVALDDGPVIFGHVRGLADGSRVPARVRLVIAADRSAVPWFWFESEEGS